MLKFVETKIVFKEVPNEITLAINISGCPCHCKGCHSEYLAQDIGDQLTAQSLETLINKNKGITCVSFMGGDGSPEELQKLSDYVRHKFKLKTCWYSGRILEHNGKYINSFDYVKVGPYMEECGPLDSPKTNQRFYSVSFNPFKKSFDLTDLTHLFQKTII